MYRIEICINLKICLIIEPVILAITFYHIKYYFYIQNAYVRIIKRDFY